MLNSLTRNEEGERVLSFDHQDMMVVILVMSLSGLQSLITELLPTLSFGGLEVGIDEFVFVPMVLVMLFGTYWAALGVPLGEVVFEEVLLGDFNAIGSIEDLLMTSLCYYFGATLLEDPDSRKQLTIAVFAAEFLDEFTAVLSDITRFYIGVNELDTIAWLPESIWIVEGLDLLRQILIAGIIFGVIPTLYFYPRLRGKIEPLLGMEPLQSEPSKPMFSMHSLMVLLLILLAFPVAITTATLSESSGVLFNIIWQPEFLEVYGQGFIAVPIVVAVVSAAGLLYYRYQKEQSSSA